jgi:hypothetical protein
MHLTATIIDKRFHVENVINAFHYTMFHGEGRRDRTAGFSCDHALGDDLSDPIQYTCNAYGLAELTMPSLNFVASSSVYEAIRDLPGLQFARVALEKVIYLPYSASDFSYFERKDFRTNPAKYGHETVFQRWPDRPELHNSVASRYEVVCGNVGLLAGAFPMAKEILIPDPVGVSAPKAERVCKKMLSEYSMLLTLCGTLLSPDAYARLKPFIDPTYFAVAKVEIDN